jgi:N-methylhydantoinase A
MSWHIGVDIGGTFTDCVFVNGATGEERALKLLSSRATPAEPVVEAIRWLLTEGAGPPEQAGADLDAVRHGSTIGINTLLERRGPPTAVVTTEGFRDILELRRQVPPHRYDIRLGRREVLVPRRHRYEIGERTYWDGRIGREVSETEVAALARRMREEGIESIAVCLLHSYANPTNEQRVASLLADHLPEAWVSVSSGVSREYREYERFATTATNAYIMAPVASYLRGLEGALERLGATRGLLVAQSNGGLAPVREILARPVVTLYSGPSAGVIGATRVAGAEGEGNLITFDMGGTSCDVALVKAGVPRTTYEKEAAGTPIKVPRVDVYSIGAGGGSLAWIDRGGLLKVGPRSAGADPGPACYGRGGTEPTVTDANLVLGRLGEKSVLGGNVRLEPEAAERAIARAVAEPLGMSLHQAAWSIVRVVNASMARAVRVVSVEAGFDPREFLLMAFGGAGPLHACELARELGCRSILVPPEPGLLCAQGLLSADGLIDRSLTRLMPLSAGGADGVNQALADLGELLARDGLVSASRGGEVEYAIDLRYQGQSYELTLALPALALRADDLDRLQAQFEQEHERVHGYAFPAAGIEVVAFRARVRFAWGLAEVPAAAGPAAPGARPREARPVFSGEAPEFQTVPVYSRGDLGPGTTIDGPAVVEQMDATTYVAPGFTATVGPTGSLRIWPPGGGPPRG